MDVYRKALPMIEDERLRRDVKAFIGQEATHARAGATTTTLPATSTTVP